MTTLLGLRTTIRISKSRLKCCGSSVVEHTLGKGEVGSSILPHSTSKPSDYFAWKLLQLKDKVTEQRSPYALAIFIYLNSFSQRWQHYFYKFDLTLNLFRLCNSGRKILVNEF